MTKDTIGPQSKIGVKAGVVPCALLPPGTQCKLLGSPCPPLSFKPPPTPPPVSLGNSFSCPGLGLKVISPVKSLLVSHHYHLDNSPLSAPKALLLNPIVIIIIIIIHLLNIY